MDYAALHAELAKPAYAGLSDDEIAAAVNAATVTVMRPVQSADARRYLMLVGKWPAVAALARGLIAGSDAEKLAAVALVEGLAMIDSFDVSVPEYAAAVEAQLAACVAAGLIDDADKAAIIGLKDVVVPLFAETVTVDHIADMRLMAERGDFA